MNYEEMSLEQLASEMRNEREQLDDLKATIAQHQKTWDDLRKKWIPEKMEELGLDQCRLNGIGTLSLRTDAYCSVPAIKKEELYAWLLMNEHEALVTSTVNASTLKAFMKEQMLAGNAMPPEGVVNWSPYTYVAITK